MISFTGLNFSLLYYYMLEYFIYSNIPLSTSRIGNVKDIGSAYFEISEDNFRLVCLNKRIINPFFALAEFSWIICGSNSLKTLQYFIDNYSLYSDDGNTLNGAYGFRLRNYFEVDQVSKSIELLKKESNTRRVVLSMWSVDDLGNDSKDLPCNTSLFLKIRDGKLDVTVINRSNDLYLGVPYNVFVFHLLQKYIANKIGLEIGVQRHFTDSLHLYEKHFNNATNILDYNNKNSISASIAKIKKFDINKYLNINHKNILDLNFNAIKDTEISNFFKSYQIYKNSLNFKDAIKLLPMNILGFIGYQWYRSKKAFPMEFKINYFENIIHHLSLN